MGKKCKGTGKAAGHGCGVELPYSERNGLRSYKAKYGLGLDCKCYQKWLLNPDGGKDLLDEAKRKAKKKAANEQAKKQREKKKRMKLELMTANKYRSRILQPIINHIAREIDKGHPCIATGNYGKMNGGHYIHAGANVTIALNLHNIHVQSFESNHHKSGDLMNYQAGIIRVYGEDYLEYVDGLKGCPPNHHNKQVFIEAAKVARKILKELKAEKGYRTPIERIKIRNEANERLSLYPVNYSVYKFPKK